MFSQSIPNVLLNSKLLILNWIVVYPAKVDRPEIFLFKHSPLCGFKDQNQSVRNKNLNSENLCPHSDRRGGAEALRLGHSSALRKEPAEGGTQSIICDVAAWKIPRNKHP